MLSDNNFSPSAPEYEELTSSLVDTKSNNIQERRTSTGPIHQENLHFSGAALDPRINYLFECRKERIGRTISASKKRVSFTAVIENTQHCFQVEHSVLSGKYSIYLDGMFLNDVTSFLDSGLLFDFPVRIEGRVISLFIVDKLRFNPLLFEYTLLVDGIDIQVLTREKIRTSITTTA